MKKYELIKRDFIYHKDRKLFRIKALRDSGSRHGFKKGDLGGYIESEKNLSHKMNCFVYDNAKVWDFGQVYENASISGDAEVCGTAKLFGEKRLHKGIINEGMHDSFRKWPEDYIFSVQDKEIYKETGKLFRGIRFIEGV